jgi:hypothetical protein
MNDRAPDDRKKFIAEAAIAELAEKLVTIDAGQLVPVDKNMLRKIIARMEK